MPSSHASSTDPTTLDNHPLEAAIPGATSGWREEPESRHNRAGGMRNVWRVLVAVLVAAGLWRAWVAPAEPRHAPPSPPTVRTTPASVSVEPAGRAVVEVPLLVGVDDSFAKHLLQMTHLVPGEVRLERSDAPWGSVIGQSIGAGASVRAWTTVDLVLAKGSVPEPCRLYWCSTGAGAAPHGDPSRTAATTAHAR
jgi:hypothetical protein